MCSTFHEQWNKAILIIILDHRRVILVHNHVHKHRGHSWDGKKEIKREGERGKERETMDAMKRKKRNEDERERGKGEKKTECMKGEWNSDTDVLQVTKVAQKD